MYKGFKIDDLKKVFASVCDPDDWRGQITASVPGELVMAAVAAIEFYTATTPEVKLNMTTMRYLVTSEGYRMGPAGP